VHDKAPYHEDGHSLLSHIMRLVETSDQRHTTAALSQRKEFIIFSC